MSIPEQNPPEQNPSYGNGYQPAPGQGQAQPQPQGQAAWDQQPQEFQQFQESPEFQQQTVQQPPQTTAQQPQRPRAADNQPWYGIPFVEAIKRFWLKYVVLSGRASRSEYWWPFLVNFAVLFLLALIPGKVGNWLFFLAAVCVFLPALTVAVRRLHDQNLRGWWLLVPVAVVCLGLLLNQDNRPAEGLSSTNRIGAILFILSTIGYLVLMALPSRSAGVRFDSNPQGQAQNASSWRMAQANGYQHPSMMARPGYGVTPAPLGDAVLINPAPINRQAAQEGAHLDNPQIQY